jgi:single-stranded DNA-binding protein
MSHTAILTIAPTGPSLKVDDYEFHTPCLFRKLGDKDNDQVIDLITSVPVPSNCKLVDAIGMLRFSSTIDTVELHASTFTTVLVTPDWGKEHPWSLKEGLVQRHAWISMSARVGPADSFKLNSTAKGDPVANCSIACDDHLEALAGNFSANAAWFKATFWGKLVERAENLSQGQRIQHLDGVLSFQHWGDAGDRLTVGVSVRTMLKGSAPSGIPGRDGEAPPVDEAPTEAPPASTDLPPEAPADYSDIPY